MKDFRKRRSLKRWSALFTLAVVDAGDGTGGVCRALDRIAALLAPKHVPALDGLRGVAVALVIASHSFPMIHELPWTLKRFSNLGFYGVQLFFVVSCVTLARSWRGGETAGKARLRAFALRRVFRIAPAYFLAAVGYFALTPPSAIDAARLATFVTFTNGWSPAQMPTVANAWVGVPGGWSIEAEFAFYALFPVLMLKLRGLGRALGGLVFSLPLAWIGNAIGVVIYEPIYGATATDQFVYYWLPNQLPVFFCGLVAYEIARECESNGPRHVIGRRIAAMGPLLLTLCAIAFLALAILPWPRLPQLDHGLIASHVMAAAAFGGAVVVLLVRPMGIIANPLVVGLGKASFSAYLIHFAVITGLERALPAWVFTRTEMAGALTSVALFLLVLALTAGIAQATYLAIEVPAIRLGSLVIFGSSRRALTTT